MAKQKEILLFFRSLSLSFSKFEKIPNPFFRHLTQREITHDIIFCPDEKTDKLIVPQPFFLLYILFSALLRPLFSIKKSKSIIYIRYALTTLITCFTTINLIKVIIHLHFPFILQNSVYENFSS